jgi:Tol biopolymer transport system component
MAHQIPVSDLDGRLGAYLAWQSGQIDGAPSVAQVTERLARRPGVIARRRGPNARRAWSVVAIGVSVALLVAALWFAAGSGAPANPSPSIVPVASGAPVLGSNEVIVYTRAGEAGQPGLLYAIGADRTPRLLFPTAIECCVSVSPDGTLVAFEVPTNDGKHVKVGLVNTDSSNLRFVERPAANLSPALFLPDGRLTTVTWTDADPGPTSIDAFDPTASDPLAAVTTVAVVNDAPLSVSPDGTQLLVALPADAPTPGQLLVVNTDGSGQHPFSPHAVKVGDDPFWGPPAAWSRDGSKVTFSTGTVGQRQTYVANADGTDVISIGASLTGAQWSPAQDLLVLDRQLSTGNGVVLVRPDGTVLATLASPGSCCPAWSPDGTRVVAQSGVYLHGTNLWLLDLAGQQTQLTADVGSYAWVNWGRLP